MFMITGISDMQRTSEQLRLQGKRIAIVPTMGYLHEGHLSLIRLAREHSDVVITTIFVNPTQFAPGEDFEKYPRDLEQDRRLAASAGCDIVFHPDAEEMYPQGYLTYVEVEKLAGVFEGAFRPTHFRGVSTVVTKLFSITKPHVAVFGQKDAQQALVIRQMTRDLNLDVQIIVAPIVREADGLALSSRNVFLAENERRDAVALNESLRLAEKMIQSGERDAQRIVAEMKLLISRKETARMEYVEVVDADSLENIVTLGSNQKVLIAVAVRFGGTRLIDNTLIELEG